MHTLQEAEIARALAVLVVAHFDPATQDRPRLRQCLSVFFPAYAGSSSVYQHHIARAFRRAARGALAVGPIRKAPAPQVMRYMLQVACLSSCPCSKNLDSSICLASTYITVCAYQYIFSTGIHGTTCLASNSHHAGKCICSVVSLVQAVHQECRVKLHHQRILASCHLSQPCCHNMAVIMLFAMHTC